MSTPKYHPLSFTAESILAIQRRQKTQTRRVIVPQPMLLPDGLWQWKGHVFPTDAPPAAMVKHKPGDFIWCKEATRMDYWGDLVPIPSARYVADSEWVWDVDSPCEWFGSRTYKPPMFMPRAWSRFTPEVLASRAERVQAISDKDARAEGAMYHDGGGAGHSGWRHNYEAVYASPCASFAGHWDKLNARRGYGWPLNPWVEAITFRLPVGGEEPRPAGP